MEIIFERLSKIKDISTFEVLTVEELQKKPYAIQPSLFDDLVAMEPDCIYRIEGQPLLAYAGT